MNKTLVVVIVVETESDDDLQTDKSLGGESTGNKDQNVDQMPPVWKDTRPPMDPKFQNRHQEFVASGGCPKKWYGVL